MTQKKTLIRIASDFSRFPAGRYYDDGDATGQAFRERLMLPVLQQGGHLTVDLDGTEGYGSSFLEEAFGGLIRDHGFTLSGLKQQMVLISPEDPSLIAEVEQYLEEAQARKVKGR